MEYFTDTPTER